MTLKLVEHQLLLLPGWDGTGWLFRPLLNVLPPEMTVSVASYPAEPIGSYSQLLPYLRDQMPWNGRVTVVSESWSAPLALELAVSQPEQIGAVVLVNGFITNPFSGLMKKLLSWWQRPWWRRLPSAAFIRKNLLGETCADVLVDAFEQALRSVPIEVLVQRLELMATVDARPALARCRQPILYLLGSQDDLVGSRAWPLFAPFRPDMVTMPLEGPHLLLQSKPRECAQAIEAFLNPKNTFDHKGQVTAPGRAMV